MHIHKMEGIAEDSSFYWFKMGFHWLPTHHLNWVMYSIALIFLCVCVLMSMFQSRSQMYIYLDWSFCLVCYVSLLYIDDIVM